MKSSAAVILADAIKDNLFLRGFLRKEEFKRSGTAVNQWERERLRNGGWSEQEEGALQTEQNKNI